MNNILFINMKVHYMHRNILKKYKALCTHGTWGVTGLTRVKLQERAKRANHQNLKSRQDFEITDTDTSKSKGLEVGLAYLIL